MAGENGSLACNHVAGVTVYAGAGDIKIRMKDGTVITDPVNIA